MNKCFTEEGIVLEDIFRIRKKFMEYIMHETPYSNETEELITKIYKEAYDVSYGEKLPDLKRMCALLQKLWDRTDVPLPLRVWMRDGQNSLSILNMSSKILTGPDDVI